MLASLLTLVVLAAPGRALPVRPPALAPATRVRAANPDAAQSLKLGLVLRDRAGLDALIAAQHDPASPLFRRWLSPRELGERFGVPASQYESLARALERSGLHVTRFPNRLYLDAQGTVAQVQRLLGIKLVEAEGPAGTFRTFEGTPRLPGELAPYVQSVHGLDNRPRFQHRLQVGSDQTFGPQDLRRYYHVEPLLASGYGGQLSKVAVMGTIPDATNAPNPDEIYWFYRNVSDSSAQFIVDQLPLGSGQPDTQAGLKVELEMDAEMPTVAAPLLQSVTMILASNSTLFPDAMNEIVNNHPDLTAVSISFGTCELLEHQYAPGEITTVSNLVAEGVAEGIAWFSASGDYGVLTCYPQQDASTQLKPSVDFPSAIPYMTAVGGTMYTGGFDANGAVTAWGNEVTWHEGGPQQGFEVAGGGGVSTVFPRPVWQTGPGTSDGGFREVPDFSLVASSRPGVAIVSTRPGVIDPIGNGTSDAAPLAAGMFALLNDAIGGCRVGSPNPMLYALGQAQYGAAGPAVFHDITSGDISVYGVTGPAAGAGYDEATGLGSLDVTALVAAWPACAPAPADLDAGSPDGGDLDAGPVDAGDQDGGPAIADAGYLVWDGGYALDAGPRAPYAQCDVIACDGGATCNTIPEGPSQCLIPCDPTQANTCGSGNYCKPSGSSGVCQPGCAADTDCGANQICQTCSAICVNLGNPDAGIGAGCGVDSDCQTGGACLPAMYGFPGGYCSQDCSNGCGCGGGAQCLFGYCFEDCDLATNTGCRTGYVCDPLHSHDGGFRPTGACLADCRTVGNGCFSQNDVCDPNTGVCAPPGWTPPVVDAGPTTSSSSGSTGGSSSSSGSTTGGTSGSTGTSANPGITGDKGSGCGCGAGGNAELPWALLLVGAAWASRRRILR